MANTQITQQQAEKRAREQRIEDLLLRGNTSRKKIAYALNLPIIEVANNIEQITTRWTTESIKKASYKRTLRIRQLEHAATLALASYERSRQDIEQVTTSYHKAKCSDCKGTGLIEERWCPTCKGTGKITVEDVTKRVTGQAGDPAFLRTFKECIVECAKLEGVYPRLDPKHKPQEHTATPSQHLHLHGLDLSKCSPQALLAAKQALAELTTHAAVLPAEATDAQP